MASNNNHKNKLKVCVGQPTRLSEPKEVECIFNNFESHQDHEEELSTPLFESHGHKWMIEVYPWGAPWDTASAKNAREKKMVSIYLYMKSIKQPTKVKFSFRIGNVHRKGEHTFDKVGLGSGWPGCISRSDAIESLNENGALICNVTIQGWFPLAPSWRPDNSLREKARQLYNSEDGSDVSFVFDGDILVGANSHVLALQCPSLYELVQEADDKTNVEIENTDAELFKLMVHFMHCENLPSSLFDLKIQGFDLLKLANRFEYPNLKMHIEAGLVDSNVLKVDNAADSLLMADGHCCALLKEAAMDFIMENFAEVMKSKGWSSLRESPDLLDEVLHAKFNIDSAKSEKVCYLRKRLADQGEDADGTKEMLVKRLKRE